MNCNETPHCDDYFVSTEKRLIDHRWLVANLLSQSWAQCWTHERMGEAVANSLCFGLYKHTEAGKADQMVGFARVITDGTTYSLLVDVVIDPLFRGQKLGRFLVASIMNHHQVKSTVALLRTNTAVGFYEKLGFKPVNAMRRIPE